MAEDGARAAKRCLIINTAGLNQSIYFKNNLTSKFKPKDMLVWKRGFIFAGRK